MSDNFLNKLRQIRQKYGISEAQYRAVEPISRQSFMDTQKSIMDTRKSVIAYRPRSHMKRSLYPSYQQNSNDYYQSQSIKRNLDLQIATKTPLNESSRTRPSGLMAQKATQRASSHQKIALSSYNTIDAQNLKPLAQKYHFQPKTFERTPLTLNNNIQNLKLLYQPTIKPVSNIPSFSYARQPLQLNANNWTIDKLSHVQEKIKAYLKK